MASRIKINRKVILSTYRNLLRLTRKRLDDPVRTQVSWQDSPYRSTIVSEYHKSKGETDKSVIKAKQQSALNLLGYLEYTQMYEEELVKASWGTGGPDKSYELVEKVSKRVGFQLPKRNVDRLAEAEKDN